jgi:hypothetical protein
MVKEKNYDEILMEEKQEKKIMMLPPKKNGPIWNVEMDPLGNCMFWVWGWRCNGQWTPWQD